MVRCRRQHSLNTLQEDEQELLKQVNFQLMPKHIAIIMDGNGRWAQKRGLPRAAGHRAGVESLKHIVKACLDLQIKYLTVYAFSTENWKRPKEEVNILMNLLTEYLEKEVADLHRHKVRINPIGRIKELPETAQIQLQKAVSLTTGNSALTLNVALNYGGRAEIIDAVKAIYDLIQKGLLSQEEIDEGFFSTRLYTAGCPDPDLLIRPSGEMRISNFLLWQLAYTEFWVTDTLWPDFRKIHLLQALIDYQKRDRRFGGL